MSQNAVGCTAWLLAATGWAAQDACVPQCVSGSGCLGVVPVVPAGQCSAWTLPSSNGPLSGCTGVVGYWLSARCCVCHALQINYNFNDAWAGLLNKCLESKEPQFTYKWVTA